MRINLFIFLAVFCFWSCQQTEPNTQNTVQNPVMKLTYPETKTVIQTDDYHGTEINDPYRWLEIDTAQDVEAWVTTQNDVTFDYLEKIPYRQKIKERYEDLFNYPKLSSPFKVGEYYFFYKNDGLQNQSVILHSKRS